MNKSLNPEKAVISTGGSRCLLHRGNGTFIRNSNNSLFKIRLYSLERRLGNLKQRGVVLKEGQTLKDLYDERCPLYENMLIL